jgi:hypothetical protein
MKQMMLLMALVMLGAFSGCKNCPVTVSPKPPVAKIQRGNLELSQDEINALCSKNNVELSDDLKNRLLKNSDELKLTPEEMQVLKSTGKVVFCGKCGYLLGEQKYKDFEANKGQVINVDKETGFAKDSLRERIIKKNLQD